MPRQSSLSAVLVIISSLLAVPAAIAQDQAKDQTKYPDWKGQWRDLLPRGVGGQSVRFDQTKPYGRGQEAPLTAEYQKVHEASMAEQAEGGIGNWPGTTCRPNGMPRMMAVAEFEYIVQPETTYILIGGDQRYYRRIYTDGRPWPQEIEPTHTGYSIGRWVDEHGSGRFNVLEVETRGPFKGPRAYDATGLPLAFDNQSIFQERFYLDNADPNILHDMITVIDHALTRPWTVDKRYRRDPNPRPAWREDYCIEGNADVVVGKEHYFLSADGFLMPVTKNQAPPDLRYFKQSQR
jgi:hypothetical protein